MKGEGEGGGGGGGEREKEYLELARFIKLIM
jgi:hypothetical protein